LSEQARQEVLGRIREVGIIPVVRAASADEAAAAVGAIRAGGIPLIEITMTVPGALRLIEDVARRSGAEVLVGAGTVLDAETAQACIQAGARFVVSPVLDLDTIACCHRHGVPVFPGALTPTEVLLAWRSGADMVKVFPCGSLGGASYVRALKAPLPQIELVPTGGVSLENAADFIEAGASALGVGSDLVDLKALRSGHADLVTERARRLLEIVATARAGR
jgi:2-dehydro-3-deoxyphosphogluconate aldolase / (4S)-4-hydroxy-2-oxoglutarate aldolase